MPIRVLLADDHEQMRDAIGRHLGSDSDIEIVAVAQDFRQAVGLVSRLGPDVVLLDLHMPAEKSLSSEQVKASLSGSRIIAMSLSTDEETKELSDLFGALVLLDKSSLFADLIPAIKLCAKV